MVLLRDVSPNSAITSVEFIPVPEGNTAFFRLKEGADAAALKQWLTQTAGQTIEAETQINKQTILVTRGDKTQDELVSSLRSRGENLEPPPEPKKKLNMWKARGALSMIGQPMQLLSGWLAKGGMDTPTIGFATANLLANFTNMIFGAEKKTDVHHLNYVETEVNKRLTPYLPQGAELPAPGKDRAALQKEPEQPKTVGQKFHDFMKRHSVMLGEIGLRYVGGLALIFSFVKVKEVKILKPKALEEGFEETIARKQSVSHWAEAAKALYKNEIKITTDDTTTIIKNPDVRTRIKVVWDLSKNPDKFTRVAGTGWIMGKNIAFFSKVPDPYNPDKPEPGSARDKRDKIRENVTFKLSTATEATGASVMAYDRFFNRRITIKKGSWVSKIIPEHLPNWLPEKIPGWKPLEVEHEGKKIRIRSSQMSLWKPEAKIGETVVKLDLPFWERAARVVTGENLPGMKLRGLKLHGSPIPDFIGGIGAVLFAAAFAMRFNAPFGTREVNMEELNAHVTSALAQLPPDKIPQALAETSAYITDHFKKKDLQFGQVYSDLASDLYRYHNIALPGADGGTGAAKVAQATPPEPEHKKTFADPALRKSHPVAPPGSFKERVSTVTEGAALSA